MKTIIIGYWFFSIVYEAIHFYIARKQFLKKVRSMPDVLSMKDAFMQQANIQVLVKNSFNPYMYFIYAVLGAIISPILFPHSLFYDVKKLVGYKTALEKKAEEDTKLMEEARKRSEEFMRTEGVYEDIIMDVDFENPEEIKPEKS